MAPANDPGASAIAASQIESQLATANVVIATAAAGSQAGDISVEQSIRWGTNSGLTLSAFHDIIVAAGVTIANTNQASGTLVLRADNSRDRQRHRQVPGAVQPGTGAQSQSAASPG